jgi:hypothetical protein
LQSGGQIQVTGTMRSRITNRHEQHFRSDSGDRRILSLCLRGSLRPSRYVGL